MQHPSCWIFSFAFSLLLTFRGVLQLFPFSLSFLNKLLDLVLSVSVHERVERFESCCCVFHPQFVRVHLRSQVSFGFFSPSTYLLSWIFSWIVSISLLSSIDDRIVNLLSEMTYDVIKEREDDVALKICNSVRARGKVFGRKLLTQIDENRLAWWVFLKVEGSQTTETVRDFLTKIGQETSMSLDVQPSLSFDPIFSFTPTLTQANFSSFLS